MLLLFAIIATISSCSSDVEDQEFKLETNNDSLSYIIGTNVGKGIAQNYPELNKDALNDAINDMLNSEDPKIADSLAQATMNRFMLALQQEEEQKQGVTSFLGPTSGRRPQVSPLLYNCFLESWWMRRQCHHTRILQLRAMLHA